MSPNTKHSSTFNRDTQLFLSASSAPGNRGTQYYNYFFQERGLNAVYLARKAEDAQALIQAVRTLQVKGCSVSMPLKTAVIPFLDHVDPLAKRLQSVNTIVASQGKLSGYNTDYDGFIQPILRRQLKLESVLIYGYGSVVNTIVHALRDHYPEIRIQLTGRNPEKVRRRAGELNVEGLLSPTIPLSDLLVNATPSSFDPSLQLMQAAKQAKAMFDILVSDSVNPILKPTITGIEMFKYQFLHQFELYTGIKITETEYDQATKRL